MKKALCLLVIASSFVACSDKKTIETKIENQFQNDTNNENTFNFTTTNRVDYFRTKHMLVKNFLNKLDLTKFRENIEYSYFEKDIIDDYEYTKTDTNGNKSKVECKVSFDLENHIFQSTNKTKTYYIEKISNTKILAGGNDCVDSYGQDSLVINEFKTMKKERIIPALSEVFENREKSEASKTNNDYISILDSKILFTGNSDYQVAKDENGKIITSQTLNKSIFDIDNLLTKLSITDFRENLNLGSVLNEKLTEACRYDFEFLGNFSAGYKYSIDNSKSNCEYSINGKSLSVQEFLDGKSFN